MNCFKTGCRNSEPLNQPTVNVELFRDYCKKKKGVTEEFPFDNETLAFKVMGKAFAFTSLNELRHSCNLKCDPERAEELREKYASIKPGYHMNKKHWNTVEWDGSVPEKLILDLVDHSYELVVSGLTKKLYDQLAKMKK